MTRPPNFDRHGQAAPDDADGWLWHLVSAAAVGMLALAMVLMYRYHYAMPDLMAEAVGSEVDKPPVQISAPTPTGQGKIEKGNSRDY